MVENPPLTETLTGLVIFEISSQEFCADIRDVSAIINPAELDPDFLARYGEESSISINNLLIPIIEFNKIFGIDKASISEDLRILTMEPGNKLYGFYVDRVKEIFTMSKDFKNKLEFKAYQDDPNLIGILRYEGRNLYLPDFYNLYK